MARIAAARERPGRGPSHPRNRIGQEPFQQRNRLRILSHAQLAHRTHPKRWRSATENALDSRWRGPFRLSQETAEAPGDNEGQTPSVSLTRQRRAYRLGSVEQTSTTFHTDFSELVLKGLTEDR